MKTYTIDARYYIQAENEEDLDNLLGDMGIYDNEYYGGYEIVSEEEQIK